MTSITPAGLASTVNQHMTAAERAELKALIRAADVDNVETRGSIAGDSEYRTAFKRYLRTGATHEIESRAAAYDAGNQVGTGTAGGYTVPQEFYAELLVRLKAYGGIYGVSNVVETADGRPMLYATNDPTGNVGAIIPEAQGDTFLAETFGTGTLQAWTYTSKVLLASYELLEDSEFDIESLVTARTGERIGRAVAAHLQTGSGTGQPLGIQTALAAATGRTVQGSATDTLYLAGSSTSITANATSGQVSEASLRKMIAAVDVAYRDDAHWVMSDSTFINLSAHANSLGDYLYPTLRDGRMTLLGYPIVIDNNTGNVPTAVNTTGGLIFGNIAKTMLVRQVKNVRVVRLDQRYADARQVAWFSYLRLDQRPADTNAAVLYESPSA